MILPDTYESPLASRYASKEMLSLCSPKEKYTTWRRLWIELARAEQSLGLPITKEQIDAMTLALHDLDKDSIAAYEKKLRHEVMAHIHAFSEKAPEAKNIIHLGATSSFVMDNGDLILIKKALGLVNKRLLSCLQRLSSFAKKHAKTSCLGYTHFQPAQPTTIGKRTCLWIQDLLADAKEMVAFEKEVPFLGVRGATGTQYAFSFLFKGESSKLNQLDEILAAAFGFDHTIAVCSQTYPRKIDVKLANLLVSLSSSLHKLATDIRLLSHTGELVEKKEKDQIGSSAMPYKQNPILSERICSLSRHLMSLCSSAPSTAANQWLERSLDDSACRRLMLHECFLCIDSLLILLENLINRLYVDIEKANENLSKNEGLFLQEGLLMLGALRGGCRQDLHQKLMQITAKLNSEKGIITKEDLLCSIKASSSFTCLTEEDLSLLERIPIYGKANFQCSSFLQEHLTPFLESHTESTEKLEAFLKI